MSGFSGQTETAIAQLTLCGSSRIDSQECEGIGGRALLRTLSSSPIAELICPVLETTQSDKGHVLSLSLSFFSFISVIYKILFFF